jgi:ribosomal protein S18 acetylase RimI-like enzyme
MIIRAAKLRDAPAVLELWQEFMKYHAEDLIKKDKRLMPHLEKKKDAPMLFFKYLKNCLRSKEHLVVVAEDNKKLVAYSLLEIKKNIPIFKAEKIGHFHDLFVKKEYRGKRISSMLKEKGIAWFKKNKIKYLSIQVYNDNEHAHNIYKKWGFFDFHIEMRRKI